MARMLWLVLVGFSIACLSAAARADGVVEIADPSAYRQVLAISDVHGMMAALRPLLTGAGVVDGSGHWIAGPTLLIVVGDSIDKGPESVAVLDTWMRLAKEAYDAGGRLLHLLGNHEAEFLADPSDDHKARELFAELRRKGIPVSELTDPQYPRARFLRSMPVAARVGRWLFCHAGLYPDASWQGFSAHANELISSGDYSNSFFLSPDSILEAKGWWEDDDTRADLEGRLANEGFFGEVFGHQPAAFGIKGRIAAIDGLRLIKIDNGMAPEAGAHSGHLLQFAKPSEMLQAQPPHVYSIGESGQPVPIESERIQMALPR